MGEKSFVNFSYLCQRYCSWLWLLQADFWVCMPRGFLLWKPIGLRSFAKGWWCILKCWSLVWMGRLQQYLWFNPSCFPNYHKWFLDIDNLQHHECTRLLLASNIWSNSNFSRNLVPLESHACCNYAWIHLRGVRTRWNWAIKSFSWKRRIREAFCTVTIGELIILRISKDISSI